MGSASRSAAGQFRSRLAGQAQERVLHDGYLGRSHRGRANGAQTNEPRTLPISIGSLGPTPCLARTGGRKTGRDRDKQGRKRTGDSHLAWRPPRLGVRQTDRMAAGDRAADGMPEAAERHLSRRVPGGAPSTVQCLTRESLVVFSESSKLLLPRVDWPRVAPGC